MKQTPLRATTRYEQQVNKADMDRAAELAKALDVPLAYLFADADDPGRADLEVQQVQGCCPGRRDRPGAPSQRVTTALELKS